MRTAGTPHLFEVVHLEGETGPGEDDDEGQLPEVGGDTQNRAVPADSGHRVPAKYR